MQEHPENQVEFEKLMKYVENNIKGRTVCQDCGCEYVTKYVLIMASFYT
jgi:transcription initiation factor TFIIIB Brf1 subunit/transcription initiation factor TFIIB